MEFQSVNPATRAISVVSKVLSAIGKSGLAGRNNNGMFQLSAASSQLGGYRA
jgi:hypothetical protein